MTLSSRQRAALRSLAHDLKPVQQIGKEGLTPAVVAAAEDALRTRELLKIRVLESAPGTPAGFGRELTAAIRGAQLVQVVGRVLVVYRAHPETPEIRLPD
jgi:RNA-binding protein